jgi:hypothetical protein
LDLSLGSSILVTEGPAKANPVSSNPLTVTAAPLITRTHVIAGQQIEDTWPPKDPKKDEKNELDVIGKDEPKPESKKRSSRKKRKMIEGKIGQERDFVSWKSVIIPVSPSTLLSFLDNRKVYRSVHRLLVKNL